MKNSIILASVGAIAVLIARPTAVLADHYADMVAGKTFFIIDADAPGHEEMKHAEIKGYQSKENPEDTGYIVTITKRIEQYDRVAKTSLPDLIQEIQYRVPATRVSNPIQSLLMRGLLSDIWHKEPIKTKEKEYGLDPCYRPYNSYSMWLRQSEEMVKVETGHCGGKDPRVTAADPEDQKSLNRLRDALLAMTSIQKD